MQRDYRQEHSLFNCFWKRSPSEQNVFSEILGAEKVFQLLDRSNYQFAQSTYTFQVRNIPWEE